jgi:hypothetical protein
VLVLCCPQNGRSSPAPGAPVLNLPCPGSWRLRRRRGLSGSRCRYSAAVRPEYSLGISLSWTNWRCSMMPLNQSVATCSLLAGRVGVQVVGAGEDLGGDTG